MKSLVILGLGGLLGACSWSSFDDLGTTTWVDSAGAADGVSTNSFLGVAAPGTTNHNAVFVVLGRANNSIGAYTYDPDGSRSTEGAEIQGTPTEFGPFVPSTIVFGDPYSNNVGVAAVTGPDLKGDTKVASITADGITSGQFIYNDFNTNSTVPPDGAFGVTAAVYARTDDDTGDLATTDAVLARSAQLALVSNYAATNGGARAVCNGGGDTNHIVASVARGQFDGNTMDDELVAVITDSTGTAPQAVLFHGRAITATWATDMTAVNPCFLDGDPDRTPIARIDGPTGDPNWGQQMVVGDFDADGFDDIAIASPANNKVYVYFNNGDNATFTTVTIESPVGDSGFGQALAAGAVDNMDGDELIVGAPTSAVGGSNAAGVVEVYTFSGHDANDELTLHDQQPETDQRFGVSVVVAPWAGGKHVLAVVADHEVFTYFRTGIYDDVRTH
jgi:hypothetical protein